MSEQRLDEHLRRYYASKKPSDQCLHQLSALATQPHRARPATGWLRQRHVGGMYMLVATVVLTGAVLLFQQIGTPPADLDWLVAKEIAVNHNKQLAIEFSAQDYRELNQKMQKLNFSSVASKRLDTDQYRLLGGRYCSIQGQLALQVKLQDRAGNVYTLYQTPLSRILAEVEVGEQAIDGLQLTLWHEAGLLFGLAGPSRTPSR